MKDDDTKKTERERIWRLNRQIGMTAVAGTDMSDKALVVIDSRDDVGKDLAEGVMTATGKDMRADAARIAGSGDIPTFLIILPVSMLKAALVTVAPGVVERLDLHPLPGWMRVVVLSEGGTLLKHERMDQMRPVGEA